MGPLAKARKSCRAGCTIEFWIYVHEGNIPRDIVQIGGLVVGIDANNIISVTISGGVDMLSRKLFMTYGAAVGTQGKKLRMNVWQHVALVFRNKRLAIVEEKLKLLQKDSKNIKNHIKFHNFYEI